MPVTAPTAVYRLFDETGALLYVGITGSLAMRWYQHAREREWWDDVVSYTLEWHDDADDARAAELAAIQSEFPRHNYVGVRGLGRKPRRPGVPVRFPIPADLLERVQARASEEGVEWEQWAADAYARLVALPVQTVQVVERGF